MKPNEAWSQEDQQALQQEIFESLHHPNAQEWRHKVGVLSPKDGSGKSSTRLLYSQEWVWKTDIHLHKKNLDDAVAWVRRMHEIGMFHQLWHPQKRWFILHTDKGYLPVSLCPEMISLRSLNDWFEATYWWTEMLAWGYKLAHEHKLSLDLNPSNFGLEAQRRRLYYLDDEFYKHFTTTDLAEAMISRIPEYPERTAHDWRAWGRSIHERLFGMMPERSAWEKLLEGIEEYPLVGLFHERRDAFLEGLRERSPFFSPPPSSPLSPLPSHLTPAPRREPQLICIFSDVHANLPALDAVLNEAKRLGVDHHLCLGDIVGYGPFPKACIQRLQTLHHLSIIRGNHDQIVGIGQPSEAENRLARASTLWTAQQLSQDDRAWLLALPLEIRGDRWLAVHGAPQDPQRLYAYIYELTYRDNLDYLATTGYPVCFFGHTHVQYAYGLLKDQTEKRYQRGHIQLFGEDEYLLINPGSVGQPRDRQTSAAFAIWDRTREEITFHRIEYPLDTVLDALKKTSLPEDIAARLENGW
jgi:predicted phosphodiesterase